MFYRSVLLLMAVDVKHFKTLKNKKLPGHLNNYTTIFFYILYMKIMC